MRPARRTADNPRTDAATTRRRSANALPDRRNQGRGRQPPVPEPGLSRAERRAGTDLATGAGEVAWLVGSTQTLDEHGRRVGEATAKPDRLVAAGADVQALRSA